VEFEGYSRGSWKEGGAGKFMIVLCWAFVGAAPGAGSCQRVDKAQRSESFDRRLVGTWQGSSARMGRNRRSRMVGGKLVIF